jgi:hypothetical protein
MMIASALLGAREARQYDRETAWGLARDVVRGVVGQAELEAAVRGFCEEHGIAWRIAMPEEGGAYAFAVGMWRIVRYVRTMRRRCGECFAVGSLVSRYRVVGRLCAASPVNLDALCETARRLLISHRFDNETLERDARRMWDIAAFYARDGYATPIERWQLNASAANRQFVAAQRGHWQEPFARFLSRYPAVNGGLVFRSGMVRESLRRLVQMAENLGRRLRRFDLRLESEIVGTPPLLILSMSMITGRLPFLHVSEQRGGAVPLLGEPEYYTCLIPGEMQEVVRMRFLEETLWVYDGVEAGVRPVHGLGSEFWARVIHECGPTELGVFAPTREVLQWSISTEFAQKVAADLRALLAAIRPRKGISSGGSSR